MGSIITSVVSRKKAAPTKMDTSTGHVQSWYGYCANSLPTSMISWSPNDPIGFSQNVTQVGRTQRAKHLSIFYRSIICILVSRVNQQAIQLGWPKGSNIPRNRRMAPSDLIHHHNMHTISLFLIFSLPALLTSQALLLSIASTNLNAGATASHALSISLFNFTVIPLSVLKIAYSSDWNLGAFSKGAASDYCETGCTLASTTASLNVPNTVKILQLFPTSYSSINFTFQVTLNNLINPLFASTETISASIVSSANSVLIQNSTSLQIVPSIMGCSVALASTTVSTLTTFFFTMTPVFALPVGYIIVSFPPFWSSFVSPVNSPICSSATCTLTSGNVFEATPTGNNWSASGLYTPDTVGNYPLTMIYYNSNSQSISTCSASLPVLTPFSLSSVSFTMNGQEAFLNFTKLKPALVTDTLQVTFSTGYSLTQALKALVYVANETLPLLKTLRVNTATNTLVLNPFQTTAPNIYAIRISQLIVPPTNANTSPLVIAIKRGGYNYELGLCCTYSAPVPQTALLSYSSSNSLMAVSSNYSLTMAPTLLAFTSILVTFCADIVISGSYGCYIPKSSSQVTCQAASSSTLQVSFANITELMPLVSEGSFELMIVGVMNPSVVTCSLSYTTYLVSAQLEQSNTVQISLTANSIQKAVVSVTNPTALGSSSYVFTITNSNALLSSSIVHIWAPSSVTLNCNAPVCLIDSTVLACSCVNSTYITLTLPAIPYASAALAIHSIVLQSITNPISLEPSASFAVALQSNSIMLESMSVGLGVTMLTAAPLTFTLTPTTTAALASTTYTLQVMGPLTSVLNYTVLLVFPSSFSSVCPLCGEVSITSPTPLTLNTPITVAFPLTNPYLLAVNTVSATLLINSYAVAYGQYTLPSITASPVAFSVVFNHSILGEPIQATISMDLTLFAPYVTRVVLTAGFPGSVQLGGLSGMHVVLSSLIGSVLDLSVVLEQTSIAVLLGGIYSPVASATAFWQVSLYGAGLIATSTLGVGFAPVCAAACRECTANTSYCTSCYQNTTISNLNYLDNVANTCRSACPVGQVTINMICYPCIYPCSQCSVHPSNCTACVGGWVITGNQCATVCVGGYYSNGTACLPCINNCMTCITATSCSSCLSLYSLQPNNTCAIGCSVGYFSLSGRCTVCRVNCLQCTESGCTACASGTLLPLCLAACPTSTYPNAINSQCQACQSPCASCSITSSTCTSCIPTYSLTATSCVITCLAGTYSEHLLCRSCPTACSTCQSYTNCTACNSPYLYDASAGQCVTTCIQLQIGNSCVPCLSPCAKCLGAANVCTSCVSGYLLDGSSCVSGCSLPKIASNGSCTNCYYACLTCAQPYKCSTCVAGQFIFGDMCVGACPNKTYSSGGVCLGCTGGCLNCVSTNTTCSSCMPGLYLQGTTCVAACPTTPIFYYTYVDQCVPCDPSCLTCLNGPYECASCTPPLHYNAYTLTCVPACIDPYFLVGNHCLPCGLPCKTCLTYILCATCYGGMYLFSGVCVTNCSNGYFPNHTICSACARNNCVTCNAFDCLSCVGGYYFYQGACLAQCPSIAPYAVDNNCSNCLAAHCLICSDGICTLCNSPYLVFQGSCVAVCPQNFEVDYLSNRFCGEMPSYAMRLYLASLEIKKTLPMPFCALLILLVVSVGASGYFGIISLLFIGGLCQALAIWRFIIDCLISGNVYPWAIYSVISTYLLLNFIYLLQAYLLCKDDSSFLIWLQRGKNTQRTILVLILSIPQKFIASLLFSGLFATLITSAQIAKPTQFLKLTKFSFLHFLLATLPLSVIAVFVLFEMESYGKEVSFAAIDYLVLSLVIWVTEVVFFVRIDTIAFPQDYKAYILPGLSNLSLPALSEPLSDTFSDNELPDLQRCASNEGVRVKVQIEDFKSVFDPQDYELPQRVALSELETAIKTGHFRKGKKLPRNKRRQKRNYLKPVQEESEEDQNERKGKKPGKLVSLNNYMYWQPPKKHKPKRTNHLEEKEILRKIQEKQSEFESITQGDIVFLEDDDDEQPSSPKREAEERNYQSYFNLNYAHSRHILP